MHSGEHSPCVEVRRTRRNAIIPSMRISLIAAFWGAVLGSTLLHAQQLTVKSASATAVELEWTGAPPSSSLERSAGQTFQKVATGDAGHYTDEKIDPFGTYKYRLNAGGKFSNIVTVGPPPAGVSNAAPAPKGSQLENYGPATAVAFDENGDPVIA